MKLNELMTSNAVAIASDATQMEGAEKMRMLDVGVLPVCEGENLVGILTDRDLAVRENERCGVERTLESLSQPSA